MKARIAVLASGGGSNLQALLDYLSSLGTRRSGDVVVVASDRATCGALTRAASLGVATTRVSMTGTDGRLLGQIVDDYRVDLVVLAGYLRLVPTDVVATLRGRIVNVHPALLPAFGGSGMYGARVHEAVLASGATVSGATVHFVDDAYDCGPIIAQWPVPILAGDTPASLAARVLRAEHALYPPIVDNVASGRIVLDNEAKVRGAGLSLPDGVESADATFCFGATPGGQLATAVGRAFRL